MRSMLSHAIGMLALAVALPAPAAPDSRFHVEATLVPRATSADGRFTLDAAAQHMPTESSEDGRFQLKTVKLPAVGCDPLGPDVFADGFESP